MVVLGPRPGIGVVMMISVFDVAVVVNFVHAQRGATPVWSEGLATGLAMMSDQPLASPFPFVLLPGAGLRCVLEFGACQFEIQLDLCH